MRDDSQAIVGIPEVIAAVERSLEVFPAADAEVDGKCKEVPAIPRCLHLRAVVAEVDQAPDRPLPIDAQRRSATVSPARRGGGASNLCQKYCQVEAETEAVPSCGRQSLKMRWR